MVDRASRTIRIGHRGAAGHAPENTLAAVAKGIELGSDYIEIDAQLTADGELVVIHDKRVDRTTNGHGYVSDLTVGEIRALNAGDGERIPFLAEVLAAVNGRCGLMLEIITPGIGARVVSAVGEARLTTPVVYASFLHSEMVTVREHDPSAHTLALLEGVPVGGASFALDAGVSYVCLGFDSVTAAFVEQLHAGGLTVFAYTLNDPRDIALAQDFGIDGIVSNYPERVPKSPLNHGVRADRKRAR
jgi:glycerophosphoryl diester phosphodiesterase